MNRDVFANRDVFVAQLSEWREEIGNAAVMTGKMLDRWDNFENRPRAPKECYENLLSSLVDLLLDLDEAIDAERET